MKKLFFIFLFFLFIPSLFNNVAKTINASSNCSLNIYPQPSSGTHRYTVTLFNNTNVPAYTFVNNYWVDGAPSGNPSNVTTYPGNYWQFLSELGYSIKGIAGIPITNNMITYDINLTISNNFEGVDIGMSSKDNPSFDICSQSHKNYTVTYENLALTPTPSLPPPPTPIQISPSNCSLNIYPQPVPGSHRYTVTLRNNTLIPGYRFVNNYWVDGNPSGHPANTSTISNWYVHAPNSFIYQVAGTAGTPIANTSITYNLDLTYNNSFDGVDVGLLGQNGSIEICSQSHSDYAVTYNNTSADLSLDIPLLKQTDNLWKNQTYDSANLWNPQNPSIGAWGCALTSATMVLKFHGINKLPDGANLDPGTLNDWLRKQKDGYVGNGALNWLALSRLSRLSKTINKIASFDALEFSKIISNDLIQVKDDLGISIPDILQEPGHFVVASGIQNGEIQINDPAYLRTSLNDYSNTFSSISRFAPSATDLSYIMLSVNPEIDISLKDSNGHLVGKIFTEDSINNSSDPSQNNNTHLKILYFPKPPSDDYQIALSSQNNSNYNLGIFLYDKDGNILERNESGNVESGQEKTIPLTFDGQANLYPTKVTFPILQNDLNKGFRNRQISSPFLFVSLKTLAIEAQTLKLLHKENLALNKLLKFEDKLVKNHEKVSEPTYSKLLYDVNYLETHL